MKLTDVQELAVQAVVASWVGREVFDDYFTGMQCGPISDGNFILFVHNEYYAQHIPRNYADLVAHAVTRVTDKHVSSITIAPVDINQQVRASMDSFLKSYWK